MSEEGKIKKSGMIRDFKKIMKSIFFKLLLQRVHKEKELGKFIPFSVKIVIHFGYVILSLIGILLLGTSSMSLLFTQPHYSCKQ